MLFLHVIEKSKNYETAYFLEVFKMHCMLNDGHYCSVTCLMYVLYVLYCK